MISYRVFIIMNGGNINKIPDPIFSLDIYDRRQKNIVKYISLLVAETRCSRTYVHNHQKEDT